MNYPNEITPLVGEVLKGEDDMWIYWCLQELMPKLPFDSKHVLAKAVEQIASGQRGFDEDVIELAQAALQGVER